MLAAPITSLLCTALVAAPTTLQVMGRSQLSPTGDLDSTVELTATGETAGALRAFVAAQVADELFAAVQQQLGNAWPTAQLLGVRFAGLDEPDQPFRLLLDLRISGFALVGERVLAVPLLTSRPLVGVGPFAAWLAAGRASALPAAMSLATQNIEINERLDLPAEYRLAAPWSTEVGTSAGNARATLVDADGALAFTLTVAAPAAHIDAFSQPGLAALANAVDQIGEQRFVVERGGAQP